MGDNGLPDRAVRPATLYGSRLPAHFRFDARATRRRWNWRFFVEVVNLTNYSNVFGYDYFRRLDGGNNIVLARDSEKWFTILPSACVEWSTASSANPAT